MDVGRLMRRADVAIAMLVTLAALPLQAQSPARQSTVVIVTGAQATMPVPTLMEETGADIANFEIANHLFLRLANLGPEIITSGDKAFVPLLAKSWTRRDSVMLVFDIDPRAKWHDGVAVNSRDVVFTFERARNPAIAPNLAKLLHRVESVTAEGERRVVFRFSKVYAEQMYDAVWHVAPIPAHLLEKIAPADLGKSSFVSNPIGDGPYRWVRSVPGQFIELAANEQFFLGRPAITRLLVRVAADPAARRNLVLSHEADAMDNVLPPLENLERCGRTSRSG